MSETSRRGGGTRISLAFPFCVTCTSRVLEILPRGTRILLTFHLCDMQPAPAYTKIIAFICYWLARDDSHALAGGILLREFVLQHS